MPKYPQEMKSNADRKERSRERLLTLKFITNLVAQFIAMKWLGERKKLKLKSS